MNLRAVSLALAILSAPVAAQVPSNAAKPATADADWLPMKDNDDGLVIVPVTIDGMPAMALIDTGFPAVVMNNRYAMSKGRSVQSIGNGVSIGGVQAFGRTEKVGLTIGSRSLPQGPMQVADFSGVEGALGEPIDLVIGASLIARTGLTVDYDRHRARLAPAATMPSGSSVHLDYDRSSSRLFLKAAISTDVLSLLLDTGVTAGVLLSSGSYSKIKGKIENTTDIAMAGGGGREVETVFHLPKLDIGPLNIANLTAQVEPSDGFLARNGIAGAIGITLIHRYNFSIDPVSQSFVLSPRRTPIAPETKSTVGLQVSYKSDRMVVVHVMSHSPASKSGIQEGDEICAVNEHTVNSNWSGSAMSDWGVRAPGVKYRVRLCSGKIFEVTSSRFY